MESSKTFIPSWSPANATTRTENLQNSTMRLHTAPQKEKGVAQEDRRTRSGTPARHPAPKGTSVSFLPKRWWLEEVTGQMYSVQFCLASKTFCISRLASIPPGLLRAQRCCNKAGFWSSYKPGLSLWDLPRTRSTTNSFYPLADLPFHKAWHSLDAQWSFFENGRTIIPVATYRHSWACGIGVPEHNLAGSLLHFRKEWPGNHFDWEKQSNLEFSLKRYDTCGTHTKLPWPKLS